MTTPTLPYPKDDGPQSIGSLQSTQNARFMIAENQVHAPNASGGSLRVVVQRPHEQFVLLRSPLTASATVRDVMQELRKIKKHELSRIKVLRLFRQGLWTTVIEICNLSTLHLADVEARPSERLLEVIVSSRTISPELTAAFHRSRLLQSSASFADQYPTLLSDSPSRTALLIGQQLYKRAIFWILSMALLLSLVIGLVIGFVYSRADLAVAITGGLTGMVSVFTALLVWMLK